MWLPTARANGKRACSWGYEPHVSRHDELARRPLQTVNGRSRWASQPEQCLDRDASRWRPRNNAIPKEVECR